MDVLLTCFLRLWLKRNKVWMSGAYLFQLASP